MLRRAHEYANAGYQGEYPAEEAKFLG